jgi:hypothetical protein
MIKGIIWVISNLSWLSALVTSAITIVETVSTYVQTTSEEKKAKALEMLKNSLDQTVTLPQWIADREDALLGFLIDGVVWIMNSFFGKHWGQAEPAAIVKTQTATPGNPDPAPQLRTDAEALAQAKADFQAIVKKNAEKEDSSLDKSEVSTNG